MRTSKKLTTIAILLAAAYALVGALASNDTRAAVGVAEHEEFGTYLVDADGMPLYAFTGDEDTEDGSACTNGCATVWPPLPSPDDASLATDELGAEAFASIERDDGVQQVTFYGWPLYIYATDEEPGTPLGQGVEDRWYLVSQDGDLIGRDGEAADGGADAASEEADAEPDEDADGEAGDYMDSAPADEDGAEDAGDGDAAASDGADGAGLSYVAEQVDRGEDAYANSCAKCHGPDLQGSFEAPQLRGSNFRNYWEGSTVFELYNFTHATMPLDAPGSLADETYIDLLAFIFDENSYASTGEPLEADTSVLQGLVIPEND